MLMERVIASIVWDIWLRNTVIWTRPLRRVWLSGERGGGGQEGRVVTVWLMLFQQLSLNSFHKPHSFQPLISLLFLFLGRLGARRHGPKLLSPLDTDSDYPLSPGSRRSTSPSTSPVPITHHVPRLLRSRPQPSRSSTMAEQGYASSGSGSGRVSGSEGGDRNACVHVNTTSSEWGVAGRWRRQPAPQTSLGMPIRPNASPLNAQCALSLRLLSANAQRRAQGWHGRRCGYRQDVAHGQIC